MFTAAACACPPAAWMSATVLSSEPANMWSPSFSVRAAHTTRPPSVANSFAISAPMPRLAPVTTTVLPASFATRAPPRLRRLRACLGLLAAAAPDDGKHFDLDDEPGRRERGDLDERGGGRITGEE